MAYEVTSKGSDFVDKFFEGFDNIQVDSDKVVEWLWDIRERGDSTQANRILIRRVGREGAERALNWAIRRGYIAQISETEFDLGQMSREDYIAHAKVCPTCRPMIEKKLGFSVE